MSVESTIREHLRANDTVQESIEWAEIVSRFESEAGMAASGGTPRRGAWWIAVAAAVVVLLLGLIPVLLFSTDGPQPADTATTVVPPTSVPTSQRAPEGDDARTTATTIPGPATIIPPEALPRQTSAVLDPAQLPWRRPDFENVPGLGEVGSSVILGAVGGQHLVVVEQVAGAIEDELLVSQDGVEFQWRDAAGFLVGGGDATDVIVGADLLWLPTRSGSLLRSTDGVTWANVVFSGSAPIAGVKSEFDQPIVRRGDTIVTTLWSSVFVSTDEGDSFIEIQPFGDVGGYRLVTAGATDDEFFAITAQGEDRVLIAHSADGLDWVVEPEPVDLGTFTEDAYFGTVTGDDPSLFLVVDITGAHIFKYSRDGSEIRIEEVAALDADLISQHGLIPPDDPVLALISAHHWQGRFALRRESPNWVLFLSDNGVDWGAVVLGAVQDGGKPEFSNELIFTGGSQAQPMGDVLPVPEVVLN